MKTPTMRCVEIARPGPADVLHLAQRPRPVPAKGELLIRVMAAGLNRGDVVQREGRYPPPPGASDLPGLEVSGIVDAVGEDVVGHAVGDRICALMAGGGYAQWAIAPATQCLPLPAQISWVDGAALPEALFTVWTSVWDQAMLQPSETLLVQGGASGIGTVAIQMAAALGHRVFTTAGTEAKCATCRSLGAELAVNYREQDFVAAVKDATGGRGVDVVLDMVGGDYVLRELNAMAENGRLTFIAYLRGSESLIDIRTLMHRRLSLRGSTLRSRSLEFKQAITQQLSQRVWPLVADGRIRAIVDSTFSMDQVQQAHRRLESGEHTGKIVLTMDDDR